jgi:tetraacyldisaccharide-1-P 4'-kinase
MTGDGKQITITAITYWLTKEYKQSDVKLKILNKNYGSTYQTC